MLLTESIILQTLMKWRTRVSAAAWVVVRNTHAAEDIFQNVAVKAMTREVSFDSEAALLSWAFITARREGIDWLRRHEREASSLDHDLLALLEEEWQGKTSHSSGARLDALQDCLEATPEASRQLLRLRYFDGYSCEEVGQQLGVGLDAIYQRISRLHATLRNCVENKLAAIGASGGLDS